jgi:hypothetical protein
MIKLIRIISTNWVNLLLALLGIYISSVFEEFSYSTSLDRVLFNALGVFVYGILLWIGLIVALLLLDSFLFSMSKKIKHIQVLLIIEWVVLSLPLAYIATTTSYWRLSFLAFSLALLVGQLIRRRMILKILESEEHY